LYITQKMQLKTRYSSLISVHNSYTKYRCRFDESNAIVRENEREQFNDELWS